MKLDRYADEIEWIKEWQNVPWNIFAVEWAKFLRKHKLAKLACFECKIEEGDMEVFQVNCKKCRQNHILCSNCFLKGCNKL